MFNTIRSVNYSLRRDKALWICLGIMAVFPYLMMLFLCAAQGDSISSLTPSYYFATQNMAMITALFYLGIVIISCKAVAGDSVDKTINYEILSGHQRETVFFARVVAALLWGACIPWLLAVLPVGVFGLMNGWGMETDQRDVILRMLLSIFPLLRLCALNQMFAALTKSAGKGIALGFLSDLVISLLTSLEDALHITANYALGLTNIMVLLTSLNSRQLVIDQKPVMVFDTAVTFGMVLKTLVFSLGFMGLYLGVAYYNFKKKDRS